MATRRLDQLYPTTEGVSYLGGSPGFNEMEESPYQAPYQQTPQPPRANNYQRLRSGYDQYQNSGASWSPGMVRSLQSMDWNGGQGDGTSRFAGDNVSRDAAGYTNPIVEDAIARGIVRPEDRANALWEVENYMDLLYETDESGKAVTREFDNMAGQPGRADGVTGYARDLFTGANPPGVGTGSRGGRGSTGSGWSFGGGSGANGSGWQSFSFGLPGTPGGDYRESIGQFPWEGADTTEPNPLMDSVNQALQSLLTGDLNKDIIGRRSEVAREDLDRFRKSQTATNRAALASRGLLGDGPEQTAQDRMESNIADQYSRALSGIIADESENADQRLSDALRTGSSTALGINELGLQKELGRGQLQFGRDKEIGRLGLDMELGRGALGNDQQRILNDLTLGTGRLDLDRLLGTGRLRLDEMGLSNNYNLGLGRLGLDRDALLLAAEQGDTNALLQLLQLYLQGIDISARGGTRE